MFHEALNGSAIWSGSTRPLSHRSHHRAESPELDEVVVHAARRLEGLYTRVYNSRQRYRSAPGCLVACRAPPVELLLVLCRFLPKVTRTGKRDACGCSFACGAAHLPTELERAMKLSDLTESERKVWEAAATGTLVDLRVGNSQLDSPERWAEWGAERTVRAEVIADLLIGDRDAASTV